MNVTKQIEVQIRGFHQSGAKKMEFQIEMEGITVLSNNGKDVVGGSSQFRLKLPKILWSSF